MDYILIKGNGPILITAPHVIKTNRFYTNKTKIHEAENFIYKILMKIYKKLGRKRCTIMTWDKNKIEHIIPEDPNYTNNLDTSLWFKHLKNIKLSQCVLHIDLHGMKNKSSYYDIEIGINALKKSNLKLYKKIKPIIIQEFDKLGIKYSLYGKFGGSGKGLPHKTVTDKGILLGFNSIQIELETDIRKRLVKDKKFFNKFTNILKNIHKGLVPICSLKKRTKKRKRRSRKKRTKKRK